MPYVQNPAFRSQTESDEPSHCVRSDRASTSYEVEKKMAAT